MKISKRVREEAALLLQMSACASAASQGVLGNLAFVGDVDQWGWFSTDARIVAQSAMDACCGSHGDERLWFVRDACEKAEAEALLRTGWSPGWSPE